jgi:hypothetical protein
LYILIIYFMGALALIMRNIHLFAKLPKAAIAVTKKQFPPRRVGMKAIEKIPSPSQQG